MGPMMENSEKLHTQIRTRAHTHGWGGMFFKYLLILFMCVCLSVLPDVCLYTACVPGVRSPGTRVHREL